MMLTLHTKQSDHGEDGIESHDNVSDLTMIGLRRLWLTLANRCTSTNNGAIRDWTDTTKAAIDG